MLYPFFRKAIVEARGHFRNVTRWSFFHYEIRPSLQREEHPMSVVFN